MPQKNQTQQDIGALILQMVQVIADVLVLFLQILYAFILSLGRLVIRKQPKSVDGEIVLITGAGHGMGKELSLLYAAEGATVVAWDIDEKTGNQTVKEIAQHGFPKAHFFKCDVSNRENVLAVAKEVQEKLGDVTILINNAGVLSAHPFLDHTKDEVQRIIDINVMAHFWTLEAFLPTMKKQNYGHIVCLTSMAGMMGIPNLVPYCCSKFAVRGLMEALHQELRRDKKNKIKLTSIYPYLVDTGLVKKSIIKYEKAMPIVNSKTAAKEIMKAQRLELREISVPRHLFYLQRIFRLLPEKAQNYITDFLSIAVESDLL